MSTAVAVAAAAKTIWSRRLYSFQKPIPISILRAIRERTERPGVILKASYPPCLLLLESQGLVTTGVFKRIIHDDLGIQLLHQEHSEGGGRKTVPGIMHTRLEDKNFTAFIAELKAIDVGYGFMLKAWSTGQAGKFLGEEGLTGELLKAGPPGRGMWEYLAWGDLPDASRKSRTQSRLTGRNPAREKAARRRAARRLEASRKRAAIRLERLEKVQLQWKKLIEQTDSTAHREVKTIRVAVGPRRATESRSIPITQLQGVKSRSIPIHKPQGVGSRSIPITKPQGVGSRSIPITKLQDGREEQDRDRHLTKGTDHIYATLDTDSTLEYGDEPREESNLAANHRREARRQIVLLSRGPLPHAQGRQGVIKRLITANIDKNRRGQRARALMRLRKPGRHTKTGAEPMQRAYPPPKDFKEPTVPKLLRQIELRKQMGWKAGYPGSKQPLQLSKSLADTVQRYRSEKTPCNFAFRPCPQPALEADSPTPEDFPLDKGRKSVDWYIKKLSCGSIFQRRKRLGLGGRVVMKVTQPATITGGEAVVHTTSDAHGSPAD